MQITWQKIQKPITEKTQYADELHGWLKQKPVIVIHEHKTEQNAVDKKGSLIKKFSIYSLYYIYYWDLTIIAAFSTF